MNNLSFFLFKKIIKDKFNLSLMIINVSLSFFLLSMLFTVGSNYINANSKNINTNNLLRQIIIEGNEIPHEKIAKIKEEKHIKKIQIELEKEIFLSKINEKSVINQAAKVIDENHDLIVEKIILGKVAESEKEIIISKKIADFYEFRYEDLLLKKVFLLENEIAIEKIIVGIFDDRTISEGAIIFSKKENLKIKKILIEVDEIKNVESVNLFIEKMDLNSISKEKDIKEIEIFNKIALVILTIMCLLLILVSIGILYLTVSAGMKKKEKFVVLLKMIGYNNVNIIKMLIIEFFIIAIFSFFFGMGLYTISSGILFNNFKFSFLNITNERLLHFRLNVMLFSFLLSLIGLFFILFQTIRKTINMKGIKSE